ncbi:MAG: PAS domain-containing protein [Shewanellaceae bacterium]|nr:PAS domain-containing protein [Shewanellaceae bacterium]
MSSSAIDAWVDALLPQHERLLQSNRLQALLQAMPTGVVILDADGFIVEANTVALALLGEPLHHQRWIKVIDRAFSPQEDDGHEVSLRDGRRVKISLTALADQMGELIVLTDLTETRELQQRIAHLQRLSALGEMVATLVHQVRTPLSAALLYASHLQHEQLSLPVRKKFQAKLLNRLQELGNQVKDLLLFAKDERLPLAKMMLTDVIETAIDVTEPMMRQHQCQVVVNIKAISEIDGHQHALNSVMNNLLMNAIEAKASLIVIELYALETHLVLSIKDDGCGFEPALAAKITQPFYTSKSDGTGLGLAVVHKVMRYHGGQLLLKSEAQQGCIVLLTFPRVSVEGETHAI